MRARPPAVPHAGEEGQLRIRPGCGVVELPHGGVEAHPRGGGGAANAHLAETGTRRCTPWWRPQNTSIEDVCRRTEDVRGVGGRDGDGRRRMRWA